MKIDFYRKKINNIDSKILNLLKERFENSKKIGRIKKKKGMKVLDKKREKEIVKGLIEKSNLNKKFIKKIYSIIFRESRRLQK
jgi:chorismate mutase